MRYKFQPYLGFFLLSFSGLVWVNYYLVVTQTNAQTPTQQQPSSPNILYKVREFIFNAKKSQPPVPKTGGGSRSDELCVIAPWLYKLENQQLENIVEIFRDKPMFIWQGEVGTIFIQTPENQLKIWKKAVGNGITTIIYPDDSQSLERGKIYEVFFHKGDTTSLPFPFKIIDGDRRQIIEAELKPLAAKSHSISAEEMALLRANYFIQQSLFWDAYQELLSVEKPSAELKKNLAEIKTEFCPSQETTQ